MAEHWEREVIAQLRLRLKAKERQVDAYRSGAKYQSMQDALLRLEKSNARKLEKLNKELGEAHVETVTVRELWFQIFDDCEREWDRKSKRYERKLARKDAEIEKLKKKLAKAQEKLTGKRRELYAVKTELEKSQDTVKKLRAQINRDFETSSLPSSYGMNHKKIQNSREKTGRRPGAQPGHTGHPRRKQKPTTVVQLPPPKEVQENPELYRIPCRSLP